MEGVVEENDYIMNRMIKSFQIGILKRNIIDVFLTFVHYYDQYDKIDNDHDRLPSVEQMQKLYNQKGDIFHHVRPTTTSTL